MKKCEQDNDKAMKKIEKSMYQDRLKINKDKKRWLKINKYKKRWLKINKDKKRILGKLKK